MNIDISFVAVIILGTGLYFNIGYAYIKYMNDHDSSFSHFRRFLEGGWNLFGKQEEDMGRTFISIWLIVFFFSLLSWVVWIIWKILYFIFGGLAKELGKDDK